MNYLSIHHLPQLIQTLEMFERLQNILLFVNKELEDKIFDTFDSAGKVKDNASAELKRLNIS